jgi:hypothetical protein
MGDGVMDVFQVLFWLASPFVMHPELTFVVAALFAVLLVASPLRTERFRPRYHVTMLIAMVAWIMFGLNEFQARANGWNIRVDLLFGLPILLAVTLVAAWTSIDFWRRRESGRGEPQINADERE